MTDALETRRGWNFLWIQLLLGAIVPELNRAAGSPLSPDGMNFVLSLVYFLGYLLVLRFFFRRSLAPIKRSPLRFFAAVSGALAAYYASFYALLPLLNLLSPGYSNINDEALRTAYQGSPWLLALTTVFLAPLAEETVFRLLIAGSFPGKAVGSLVSAALFSAAHIAPYLGNVPLLQLLAAFLQYLPAGLILSGACYAAGTIWAPILVHTVINAITMVFP